MAKANICDNCGKAFEPATGFAVAVMLGDRPGAPYFEAPQFEEACSTKCLSELVKATGDLRKKQHADAEAHREKVEREGAERAAKEAAAEEERLKIEEADRKAQAAEGKKTKTSAGKEA